MAAAPAPSLLASPTPGQTVAAHAGETLDGLLWRTVGDAAIEPVLAANRGLAEEGAFLPEGRLVFVPDAVAYAAPGGAGAGSSSSAPLVQLWD